MLKAGMKSGDKMVVDESGHIAITLLWLLAAAKSRFCNINLTLSPRNSSYTPNKIFLKLYTNLNIVQFTNMTSWRKNSKRGKDINRTKQIHARNTQEYYIRTCSPPGCRPCEEPCCNSSSSCGLQVNFFFSFLEKVSLLEPGSICPKQIQNLHDRTGSPGVTATKSWNYSHDSW